MKENPQWFGAAVRAATSNAPSLPPFPFPPRLQKVVEAHVTKANARRQAALSAISQATGHDTYEAVLRKFSSSALAREGSLSFNTGAHPLRESFLASSGLPTDFDLSELHHNPDAKDQMFCTLTGNPAGFQTVFDRFVRSVCIPHMSNLLRAASGGNDETYHYQVFPCIRVIQPGEFSIGPHADCAYGHHPLSINFYVPLTPIQGTSSLFLESTPGRQDWHPIVGDYGSEVRHFAGGMNAHWTTENMTGKTRVSLDFRVVPGKWFHALADGGGVTGGQKDVYREKDGYYSVARRGKEEGVVVVVEEKEEEEQERKMSGSCWVRQGGLLPPDYRVGYPFTVKPSRWGKVLRKKKAKRQQAP